MISFSGPDLSISADLEGMSDYSFQEWCGYITAGKRYQELG